MHLPVTPNRPAVSGNLAVEVHATGNDRLWVVNQDNDSVSVFDTGTYTRVAEINVGAAPRSVAVLANGQVWVTNKQTATISVIDSATLTITSTIVLPVGSQPFGIAVAPSGEAVYVVLEGLGQLLQIDPNSGTTLSGIDVGPNPRQVSVSG